MGARNRTPATTVWKTRSYSPAKCDTSVDVPPMSNPITLPNPARADIRLMPTMPPAGPERIASLPRKCIASVSPPLDCMNISRTPGSWPATRST